ncbi:MAG: DUF6512 family protein [Candidatus Bathyarchaeota archaeon]|nr:DUF6512 family protein [Candidatus Bathyarchaeum sp.]
MAATQKGIILRYELFGMLFVSLLGGALHFTFEWSGYNPIVGAFSAVNESVWEHLKLGVWPIILYTIIEYFLIKKQTNNFFLAKTAAAYSIILVIPAIFYGYTSITGESIFAIDILSFIIAVIIGQVLSYKILTYKQLPKRTEWLSLIALAVLAVLFVVFTFYPPHIELFQDSVTGEYGIIEHQH